jgi:3-deoxy-manno-octulosonate cytidylyltransferase (CMP-KDO synthetase)
MKIVAIIPAHLDSVRFPRKIVHPFHGVPMIEHVRRRALMVPGLADVVVATCDEEIAGVVHAGGGRVVMTGRDHSNGTSRVAEAAASVECSHVLLLQGDEPLLLPGHVEEMIRVIGADPSGDAWNATGPIEAEAELDRHSFVKCSVAPDGRVISCFRRSPCYSGFGTQRLFIRKILGIIAYRADFLQTLTRLTPTPIEEAEFIEQMRIIESGFRLQSVAVAPSLPSVNEPEEAEQVLEYVRGDVAQREMLRKVVEWPRTSAK